ncbi:hypothetical protein [Azotosporobacter soli]
MNNEKTVWTVPQVTELSVAMTESQKTGDHSDMWTASLNLCGAIHS